MFTIWDLCRQQCVDVVCIAKSVVAMCDEKEAWMRESSSLEFDLVKMTDHSSEDTAGLYIMNQSFQVGVENARRQVRPVMVTRNVD
jgi:hypothetical protein